jgi:hypothetical protein
VIHPVHGSPRRRGVNLPRRAQRPPSGTFKGMCARIILPDGQVIEDVVTLQEFVASLNGASLDDADQKGCLCHIDLHAALQSCALHATDEGGDLIVHADDRLAPMLRMVDGPLAGYLPERDFGTEAPLRISMAQYGDVVTHMEYELRHDGAPGYYLASVTSAPWRVTRE